MDRRNTFLLAALVAAAPGNATMVYAGDREAVVRVIVTSSTACSDERDTGVVTLASGITVCAGCGMKQMIVATANHVRPPAEAAQPRTVCVEFPGDARWYKAEALAPQPNPEGFDLAFLEVSPPRGAKIVDAARLASYTRVKKGQKVSHCGSRGGSEVQCTQPRGEVSASGSADLIYFEPSIPIAEGDSGGALLDSHGRLLGMVIHDRAGRGAAVSAGALGRHLNHQCPSCGSCANHGSSGPWRWLPTVVGAGAGAWAVTEESQQRTDYDAYLAATTVDRVVQLRRQVEGHRTRRDIAVAAAIGLGVTQAAVLLFRGRSCKQEDASRRGARLVPEIRASSVSVSLAWRF